MTRLMLAPEGSRAHQKMQTVKAEAARLNRANLAAQTKLAALRRLVDDLGLGALANRRLAAAEAAHARWQTDRGQPEARR
jgi:hypothetical protein